MSKEEFMKELEYLLQDIPEEEKEDALEYYRDYLEEAGDQEEQVLKEFGSPERIAAIIRADIAGHLEEGGEFTDHGYEDARFRDPNYQITRRYDLPETFQGSVQDAFDNGSSGSSGSSQSGEHGETRKNSSVQSDKKAFWKDLSWGKMVLAGMVILIASPILLGIGGGLFGILTGLFGVLAAAVVGIGALTFALFLGGIVCVGVGIIIGIGGMGGSMLLLGVGIFLLGLSILGFVLCLLFYGKFLPWLICTAVNAISSLVHRKENRS